MSRAVHQLLFPENDFAAVKVDKTSSTFIDNMRLPVHRWFRFSAGFSAVWAEALIREYADSRKTIVFDPFAGSGTTLLAAEDAGVKSYGIEAHPFVTRIAKAKLSRTSSPDEYMLAIKCIKKLVQSKTPSIDHYPSLIRKCYNDETLAQLDMLRQTVEDSADGSPANELVWLNLVGILRRVSHANTAQWQYVLPKKSKKNPQNPIAAFDKFTDDIYQDMCQNGTIKGPSGSLMLGDARICKDIPQDAINLVVTSPPYPNNYDYADATRLEMSFMREINGWGDLQASVRQYLVRSCSQHVPEKTIDLSAILAREELAPIRTELTKVCEELALVRLTKGGRKTYHLMVACYFLDLAQVWLALRRVCASPSTACFVIGDSAPYGVYVPVIDWLGKLALAAGFKSFYFEQTRERNIKWKNRKHSVPLCEGRLWVEG